MPIIIVAYLGWHAHAHALGLPQNYASIIGQGLFTMQHFTKPQPFLQALPLAQYIQAQTNLIILNVEN